MSDRHAGRFRLILHVGAGKTGTTSIQQYLARVAGKLAQEGVAYWGYMLDRAPVRQFPWQDQLQTELFLRMDQASAANELTQVLEQSIEAAAAAGMHTAIWSNEAIFDRAQSVLAALERLDRARVEIVVIAYVRRHDAWATSAYLQWGLRHKSYSGELVPFSRFMEMRPVHFMKGCDMWRNGVEATFLLRNYDTAGDVIADFSAALGLPLFDSKERANASPSLEEVFFRALFNSQFHEEVLPGRFNREVGGGRLDFGMDPNIWFNKLIGGKKELEDLIVATRSDRDAVNQLLASAGEPLLSDQAAQHLEVKLDTGKMMGVIAQVIISQSEKISSLEKRLDEMHKKINDFWKATSES